MTPQEKAGQLVGKYMTIDIHDEDHFIVRKQRAKQCALVAVDETIGTLNYDIRDLDVRGSVLLDLIKYWQEVKQEIEKL